MLPLSDFTKWYDGLEENTTIAGYGSDDWDLPLIFNKTSTPIRTNLYHYDLLDTISKATAEHYDSYERRVALHALAAMNGVNQDILPILFYIR